MTSPVDTDLRRAPRGGYFTVRTSKTAQATELLRQGQYPEEVAKGLKLSLRYVERLKHSMSRDYDHAGTQASDQALRCRIHEENLIAHGGFLALSEVCIGHEVNGARRMVATLPLIYYGDGR
jgi:hypothetical protein